MAQLDGQPNLIMLNVGLASHNADWNFKNVISPFSRLYYVTEGEAHLLINERWHKLTPNHMYFVPAFTLHTNLCRGLFKHYYLHLYEDSLNSESLIEQLEFPVQIDGDEYDLNLFRILCEKNTSMKLRNADPSIYDNNTSLIECVKQYRSLLLCDKMEDMGIIYQLLANFVRAAKPKYTSSDSRIINTLRHMNMNLNEEINLENIAEKSGLSRDHFIRLFKKELGCTPIQFLISKKILKAQMMLATESIPVKQVSYMLGYDDFSYFSRLFKKHTSMTPIQYRRSFNQND